MALGFAVAEIDRRAKRPERVFVTAFDSLQSLAELLGTVDDHFFEMLPVVLHLLFELALIERAFQARENDIFEKRLDEIIVRAGTNRLNAYIDILHAGCDEK